MSLSSVPGTSSATTAAGPYKLRSLSHAKRQLCEKPSEVTSGTAAPPPRTPLRVFRHSFFTRRGFRKFRGFVLLVLLVLLRVAPAPPPPARSLSRCHLPRRMCFAARACVCLCPHVFHKKSKSSAATSPCLFAYHSACMESFCAALSVHGSPTATPASGISRDVSFNIRSFRSKMARASVGTYTPAYDSPVTKKSLAAARGISQRRSAPARSSVAAVLLSVLAHARRLCASQYEYPTPAGLSKTNTFACLVHAQGFRISPPVAFTNKGPIS